MKRQKKKSNFTLTKKETGTAAAGTGQSVHFPTTGPGLALVGIAGPLLTLVGMNGLKRPGRPPQETFPATTQETRKKATLPKAAPVSAVAVGEPPGLSRPKARPKAKSTLSPSSAVLSSVLLGNFGLGSSFETDDMLTGRVDFQVAALKCANFSRRTLMYRLLAIASVLELLLESLGFDGLIPNPEDFEDASFTLCK